MMFEYQTENLILATSQEYYAPLVLDYLQRNAEEFEKYERKYPENYYTLEFQKRALAAEGQLMLNSRAIRYYIFLKDKPDFIIGNVSFTYLNEDNGHRCTIGYRIDKDYRRHGYTYEAAVFLLPLVIRDYNLHRIEADILPENEASQVLAQKLGFEYEGIAKKAHEICGVDRDHMRFSYVI